MTIDDLCVLLTECAGEPESGAFPADATDVPFEDLGYDSLALIETTTRIAAVYGVRIPDDEISELRTPRDLLRRVNDTLTAV